MGLKYEKALLINKRRHLFWRARPRNTIDKLRRGRLTAAQRERWARVKASKKRSGFILCGSFKTGFVADVYELGIGPQNPVCIVQKILSYKFRKATHI